MPLSASATTPTRDLPTAQLGSARATGTWSRTQTPPPAGSPTTGRCTTASSGASVRARSIRRASSPAGTVRFRQRRLFATSTSSPKGRTVGQVVVFLPLDRHLVGWLTQRARLSDQQELGLARGGNLVGARTDTSRPVRAARTRVPATFARAVVAIGHSSKLSAPPREEARWLRWSPAPPSTRRRVPRAGA